MCIIKNDATGDITFVTAGLDGPHTLFDKEKKQVGNDADDITATITGSGTGDQYAEFKMIADSVANNNPDSTYTFTGHSLGAVMSELYIAEKTREAFVAAIKERYGDEFTQVITAMNGANDLSQDGKNEFAAALIVAKNHDYPTDLNIDMSKYSGLIFENYGSVNNFWALAERDNDFSGLGSTSNRDAGRIIGSIIGGGIGGALGEGLGELIDKGAEDSLPYREYMNSIVAANTNIVSIQSDSENDIMGGQKIDKINGGRFSETIEVHKDHASDSPIEQHAIFTFYSALQIEEYSLGESVVSNALACVEGMVGSVHKR